MNRYFATLWCGSDLPSYSANVYDATWVRKLIRGLKRGDPQAHLMLLCDDYYEQSLRGLSHHMTIVPFEGHGCGGWSNVLEIFRPSLRPTRGERHVAIGLDSIVVGDTRWLFHEVNQIVGLPLDPYYAPEVCDAVISFDIEGAEAIWCWFLLMRDKNEMADCLIAGKPSEMILLRKMYNALGWTPIDPEAKRLMSYKVHVKESKRDWHDASIVYFHGNPKPNHLAPQDELRQLWEA